MFEKQNSSSFDVRVQPINNDFNIILMAFTYIIDVYLSTVEKKSHLTCQTQSRNKINVGALLFDLEGTESLNGPLNVLDQKGCPA